MAPTTRPRPDQQIVIRQRIKGAANLKDIGKGLLLYANEHNGAYPPDLGILARDEDMIPGTFICPAVGKVALSGPNLTSQEIGDWVNANTDYHYICGFNNSVGSETAIAFDKETNEYGDGMNILFGDIHVEFMYLETARPVIERSVALAASRGGMVH
jgi:hypothetical protein